LDEHRCFALPYNERPIDPCFLANFQQVTDIDYAEALFRLQPLLPEQIAKLGAKAPEQGKKRPCLREAVFSSTDGVCFKPNQKNILVGRSPFIPGYLANRQKNLQHSSII